MRTSAAAALAVAFGAANVAATPITKRENTGSVDDVTILNYARESEHHPDDHSPATNRSNLLSCLAR